MENTDKKYQIKLNSSNHITLHKVEEKVYTREEVLNFILRFAEDCDSDQELICYDGHINGKRQYNHLKRWFEQNVK